MRFLQSFIILWHFIICTANDDSNNENVITTPVILQDPCLLSRIISDNKGQRPVVAYKCRLRGRDSAIFGPRLLDIDGLDDSWMDSSPKRHSLQPGTTTLFIDGATISDGKIVLPHDNTIDDVDVYNPPDYLPRAVSRNRAFGEKNVLAVHVTARNPSQTSGTPADLAFFLFDEVFLTPRRQYDDVSFSQFKLSPTDAFNGIEGFADGVYAVNIDIPIVNGITWREDVTNAIDAALAANLGANWEDRIDHYIYALPDGTTNDAGSTVWFGYADLPGKMSVYNDLQARAVDTVMHEIGHNINLAHSNDEAGEVFDFNPDVAGEYDDISCIMGGGYNGLFLKGFNGAKSFQLGWYESKVVESRSNWSGRIYGVVDYDNINANVVLLRMIDSQDDDDDDYYIAFNRQAGFNAGSPEGPNKVMVTRRRKGTRVAYSWLEAELGVTEQYTKVGFGGAGSLVVEVVEINLNVVPAYAEINVMLDTFSPTISSAPSATPSPTNTKYDLTTPLSGGIFGKGMLFDVTALNDLCICAFRIHMADATFTVNIYTKADSYLPDVDLSDPDWTEGQTVVDQLGAGQGSETELPNLDTPICITAGSTQAIYLILTPDTASQAIISSYSGTDNIIENDDGNLQVWNGLLVEEGDVPPTDWSVFFWFRFEGTIEYYLGSPTIPSSPSPTSTLQPTRLVTDIVTFQPTPRFVTDTPVPTIAPLVTDPPEPVTCIIDDDCNDNDDCTEDKCINDVCSNVRVLSPKTPICGDLVCEDGETCETCPQDCRRRLYGEINRHFCCYGGPKEDEPTFTDVTLWSNIARSCEYYKCQRQDRQCDTTPALVCQSECNNDIDCDDQDSCTKDSCIDGICVYTDTPPYIGICGDGICQEGEHCENCPQDCRKRIHGASVKHFCCYGGPSVSTFLDPDTYNAIAISCTDDRCGLYDRTCDTTSAIAAVTDNGTCGTECTIDSDCNDGNICTDDKCIYGICVNPSITYSNGWCGDDICQDGENCENCPQDCRRRTWGNNVNKHFCCFGGPPNNKPTFNDPTTYDDIAITCDMYRCQRQSNDCNIFAKRDIPQECSSIAATTN